MRFCTFAYARFVFLFFFPVRASASCVRVCRRNLPYIPELYLACLPGPGAGLFPGGGSGHIASLARIVMSKSAHTFVPVFRACGHGLGLITSPRLWSHATGLPRKREGGLPQEREEGGGLITNVRSGWRTVALSGSSARSVWCCWLHLGERVSGTVRTLFCLLFLVFLVS